MTMYIYNKDTGALFEMVEADSYDSRSISGAFGTIWMGDELELSGKEDLSETLRADWRRDNPTLDELMAILLGGKEGAYE